MPAFFLALTYICLNLLSLVTFFPDIAQYRHLEVVGGLALLASVVLIQSNWPIWRHQTFYLLLGLVLAMSASSVANGWLGGALYGPVPFLPVAVILPLVGATTTTSRRLHWMRNVVVIVALMFTTIGLVDLFRGRDGSPFLLSWELPDSASQDASALTYRLRGVGSQADPNDFAQFLLICMALLKGGQDPDEHVAKSMVRWLLWLILLAGVLATRSRGALVAMVVLLSVFAFDHYRWKGAVFVSACSAAVAGLLSRLVGRDLSLSGGEDRLALWSEALGLFKQTPTLGTGVGSASDVIGGYTTHNAPLQVLLELGLSGAVCWFGLIIVVLLPMLRLANREKSVFAEQDDRRLNSWAIALRNALIVFLTTSWFLSRAYAPLLMVVIGLAYAYLQIVRSRMPFVPTSVRLSVWLPTASAAVAATAALAYIMIRVQRLIG